MEDATPEHGTRGRLAVADGQRFGFSVVIDPEIRIPGRTGRRTDRGARLRCDCGNEFERPIYALVGAQAAKCNKKQSCGCMTRQLISEGLAEAWKKRQDRPRPATFVDRAGERYGSLVAIEFVETTPKGRWLCRCDCGGEKMALGPFLAKGITRHCGCQRLQPNRLPPGTASRNACLRTYQRGARDRGLCWDLTGEDFDRLTSQDCFYCGYPPSNTYSGHSTPFVYNGIDRVDNDLGYVIENVVPCCKACNQAKMAMTFDDFMAWIARLVRHNWFRPEQLPSRMLKGAA